MLEWYIWAFFRGVIKFHVRQLQYWKLQLECNQLMHCVCRWHLFQCHAEPVLFLLQREHVCIVNWLYFLSLLHSRKLHQCHGSIILL